ncbi:hypothetical protein CDD83_9069 [Cordyceps sp. RAO-2017]|nr:hypothetical protein CDD83_9069 [Cordyceps sp. RAO-2017]
MCVPWGARRGSRSAPGSFLSRLPTSPPSLDDVARRPRFKRQAKHKKQRQRDPHRRLLLLQLPPPPTLVGEPRYRNAPDARLDEASAAPLPARTPAGPARRHKVCHQDPRSTHERRGVFESREWVCGGLVSSRLMRISLPARHSSSSSSSSSSPPRPGPRRRRRP